MKLHGNAKLTPVQRRLLVSRVLDEHWTYADVADAFGVHERTAYRWVRRGVGHNSPWVDVAASHRVCG